MWNFQTILLVTIHSTYWKTGSHTECTGGGASIAIGALLVSLHKWLLSFEDSYRTNDLYPLYYGHHRSLLIGDPLTGAKSRNWKQSASVKVTWTFLNLMNRNIMS